MARRLREDFGDAMPLVSGNAASVVAQDGQWPASPSRYFSLGPSPTDGGSPAAAAVSAVHFIIGVASAAELRATGRRGVDELNQAPQYVYEWGASSSHSEQAAEGRPVKLALVVTENSKRESLPWPVPSYGRSLCMAGRNTSLLLIAGVVRVRVSVSAAERGIIWVYLGKGEFPLRMADYVGCGFARELLQDRRRSRPPRVRRTLRGHADHAVAGERERGEQQPGGRAARPVRSASRHPPRLPEPWRCKPYLLKWGPA